VTLTKIFVLLLGFKVINSKYFSEKSISTMRTLHSTGDQFMKSAGGLLKIPMLSWECTDTFRKLHIVYYITMSFETQIFVLVIWIAHLMP